MFGPVITTEAYFVFACARTHFNNTAEMSAMIEVFSFLGPMARLNVTRAHVFSLIPRMLLVFPWRNPGSQARTAWTLLPTVSAESPGRLRFPMQHVCIHADDLEYHCADHAAAWFGVDLQLVTRRARQSYDSVSCSICHNFGDVQEKFRHIRLRVCLLLGARPGVSALFHAVCFSCAYHLLLGRSALIRLAQFFTVSMIEGCVVQWKGQMLRLFLPLRTLSTSLCITFGISCSVAILGKPFLVRTCPVCDLLHELLYTFVLSKCLQPSFVVSVRNCRDWSS